MKLKKPTMKTPEVKVPAFLADLYYDLRDRRLLPLIALVAVAIVAVPFLLGGSEPAVPPPVAVDSGGAGGAGTAAAGLAVVEARPGLRDYRKRLRSRTPSDPFRQRYTGLPESAQVEATESTTSTSTSTSGEVIAEGELEESVTEVEETPNSGGTQDAGGKKTRAYELVIDVQITRTTKTADGGEQRDEMEARRDVPVLTQLPGKKTPVVTTMGANFSKERLLFLVSHEVKAIVGEYACVTRGEVCELLEVAPGILLEFVHEPTGARYAIKVTGVDAIPVRKGQAERSSRAALAQALPGMSWKRHSFSK